MNKKNIKIGFIGAGYMGYGMAHNLLKKNLPLSVISHKNRKPIDKLIKQGAEESMSLKHIANFSNVIIMCVSNTQIAIQIIKEILPDINPSTLFIDITTHHETGSQQINNLLKSKYVRYVAAPCMGGPAERAPSA